MSTREAEARIERAITDKADILDLRGLGLKVLPLLPTELQKLQVIELGCNRLTTLPDELFTLPRLRRLGLGNNRIDTLPTSMTQLQELMSLDLSENRLERLPESIGSLSRLMEVSFYANYLTEVPDTIFELKRLERLDLSTNQLPALPLPADCRYSRLRALDVSHNRLTRISDGMKRLRTLRILSLAGNRLVSLQGLEGLVLLEELDVSNNELQSAVPTLHHLPRLRRLDISNNPLPQVERKEISQYDASREKANATLTTLISGGESVSEDAHYFDQVPFSFNADLAIGHAGIPDLIDLYYKKFSGQDVSLRLSDGNLLKLTHASRTRALDFARSALADTKPLRVRLGQAQGDGQMQAKRAFVVDALARIRGSQLVERNAEVELTQADALDSELLLQWSGRSEPSKQTSRTVSVGFSMIDKPEKSLSELATLTPNSLLWLWCTVATNDSVSGAIGGGQPLAPGIFDQAELDVAVFSNSQGFEIETCSGTLRLTGASCFVLRPADIPDNAGPDLIASRLFFKIRTPTCAGSEQLRVHLYHRGLLVQALNIIASVGGANGSTDRPAITVTTDYVLSGGLEERQLLSLGEHKLSIFTNESPGAKAGFRFYGADGEVVGSANIEETKIGTILEAARKALRQVSWGSDEAYDPARDNYRYEPNARKPYLKEDMVRLAKCGFQLWDVLAKNFAGDCGVGALERAMRRPGVVQLGLKESSSQLLPLAILYDRPIETTLKNLDGFELCKDFWEKPDCLDGRCPNHGNSRIVCPSGFWGFRHSIGVPMGCANIDASADVAPSSVRLFASAYAGEFPLRDAHLQELEKLVGANSFEKTLTYEETVKRMQKGGFQLLYFYCHGGINDAIPYVLVGKDNEDPNQIERATLRTNRIEWIDPRALVFINGCHTTALEPEQAIDLVNGFIETAHASGVIGTEVTVFEPLATKIGEGFIERLIAGDDVGTALRDARRALLFGEPPNPLGLVYIPFALATLKLEGLTLSNTLTTH
jgi:hypothetical protein